MSARPRPARPRTPPPRPASPGPLRARLDALLVERGLAPTREQAQAAILAGEVRVDGRPGAKPGQRVSAAAALAVQPRRPKYVSRGGLKLEDALNGFGIDVAGAIALDVGASTGGFTDCLLRHGAARVYAVDVGTGQLDWTLRRDPRVVVRERIHAATLDAQAVPDLVDIATVDVSFISLTRVLPPVTGRVAPGGSIVALVKPQFEAGRGQTQRGVVRAAAQHRQILTHLAEWVQARGLSLMGIRASPLLGPKGNREFFFWIVKPPLENRPAPVEDVEGAVERALAS